MRTKQRRFHLGLVVVVVSALVLSACGQRFLEESDTVTVEQLFPEGLPVAEVCPRVDVRRGTQEYPVYARGREGDRAALVFQGAIQDTVRECTFSGKTVSVDVGIAGRILLGPEGMAGVNSNLPIRFVVVRDDQSPVWSELRSIPVAATAGQRSVAFNYVERGIPIALEPNETFANYRILVGFDTQTED